VLEVLAAIAILAFVAFVVRDGLSATISDFEDGAV
jgi:hypothetical protein